MYQKDKYTKKIIFLTFLFFVLQIYKKCVFYKKNTLFIKKTQTYEYYN